MAHEWLAAKVFNFCWREIVGKSAQGGSHTDFLAHYHVVAAHEGVFGREDGHHIVIELNAQQNDEHAEKISKEKAYKLTYADMLPK